jgi:hypothetical protein
VATHLLALRRATPRLTARRRREHRRSAARTVAAVAAVVPVTPQPADAGIRTEPGALRRPQVLLTLVVSTVGFGGISAVHSHPSTATSRRHHRPRRVRARRRPRPACNGAATSGCGPAEERVTALRIYTIH